MIQITQTMPFGLHDRVKTATGTASNAFNAFQSFAAPIEEIVLIAEDNGAIFQFSDNGTIPTEDIHVQTDMMLTIPFRTWYWRVKNMVTDQNAKYKIMGFWKYY